MSEQIRREQLALLGTGLMGRPMAERLAKAGYALSVWNRTREKTEGIFGARSAGSASDAVAGASIVITMLQDGRTVHEVVGGILAALQPGTLVIDMSSTSQDEARALHEALRARSHRFLDAPVSGGVVGARSGELAIMVGGSDEDFARAEPVLGVLGRPTLVGPAGCGQLAKLCNQLIVGATLDIVAEALLLAQAGGADPAAVRAAIRGGFAESKILEIHGARMLERNFLPGGQIKTQKKDMENVLAAASRAGLRLPVTELVTEHYRNLCDAHPHADQSAALLELERANPGYRLGAAQDRLP